MKKNISNNIISKLNESEVYDFEDDNNPLIGDIVAMMIDFGWKITPYPEKREYIVNDGEFEVKVSFEEISQVKDSKEE